MSRIDSRVESFDSLCRLCASYDAVKLEIFGQEGKERSLVEKIQTCLPFQVSKNDPLPKSLCYRCMYNLENFYDFRMGCVNAVALLESCLEPDGGKHLDKPSAEKREKIMKQLLKDTVRVPDTMPQLEPEIPLLKSEKEETSAEGKDKKSHQTSDNLMPKLPSAVEDQGRNADDDVEEVDEDEEDEKVIDIDPADYLESSVAVDIDEAHQSNLSTKNSTAAPSPQKPSSEPCELFTCKICGKTLSSKGHLSLHLRIHRDDNSDSNCLNATSSISAASTPQGTQFCRPYRCDLCNKSYSSSKHLWGHVSSNHRGDPAVTCPECHRLFSSVNNLEEHKRSKHGEQFNDVCTDELVEMDYSVSPTTPSGRSKQLDDDDDDDGDDDGDSSPKKRMLIDSDSEFNQNGKRPLSDDLAGNKRKSSKPRKIARTNSSESLGEEGEGEPLRCVLCLEVFPDVGQLMEHTKKHDKEHEAETQAIAQAQAQPMMNSQSFSCLLCEKVFTLRSLLHRHLENQHGIDPSDLMDQQRDVTIKSECELNDDEDQDHHMLAESMLESETVFCCEACIREFTDRSSLWLHMLYTHKDAAATACGLCLKVCGDLPALTSHIATSHTTSQLLVEKRRYSCSVCMRQHDSRKKLLSHVLIHDIGVSKPEDLIILNSDLYQADQLDIDNEEQDSHDTSLNATPVSSTVSVSSGNAAISAAAAVAANSPFACQICLKIFPNEEKMVKHKQNAHRQDALVHAASGVGTYHLFFRCELCGVSHQSKSDRWKHVYEVHRGDPSVTCSKSSCGKVFPSAELNQEHVNHHKVQGSIPNTCEICGKLWNSRVDYWKHMMGVHAEVVPYTCGVCLKVLPDVQQLRDHVKAQHYPLTGGDYCCDICGRPYSNRSKMSRHRTIHFSIPGEDDMETPAEDDTPVQFSSVVPSVTVKSEPADVKKHHCDGCPNRNFSTREELIQHRRADHGMLTCDLCDKFYGRTSHLWKHVNKMHRGHPSVTCTYCGKISASKSHLRSHVLKMHRPGVLSKPEKAPTSKPEPQQDYLYLPQSTPEKPKSERVLGPQACPQCSKVFCNRYRMLRHLKSCRMTPGWSNPQQEKWEKQKGPIICQHCSKEFTSRSSLRDHEQRHHVMYDCELCGEGAIPSKTALMEHILIAHRGAEQITCSFEGCGMTMRCAADRGKHEKDHKTTRYPPTCTKCGEVCGNKNRLRQHMMTEHKIGSRSLCSICVAIHTSIDDLQAHVKAEHSNILRGNTCQVCAKTTGTRGRLIKHVKSHHDGASRLCTICLGFFSNQEELKKHIEDKHAKKNEAEEDESDSSSSEDENGKDNENEEEDDDDDDDEGDEDDDDDEDEEDEGDDDGESDEERRGGDGGEESQESQSDKSVEENSKTGSDMSELTLNGVDRSDPASDDGSSGSEQEGSTTSKQPVSSSEGRPRRSYKCNICKETFLMPSLLMQHQKQRHRSNSFPMQCPTCDKKFSNKLIFSNHVNLCKRERSSILQQTLETGKMGGFRSDPKDVAHLAEMAGFNGHFLEGGGVGEDSKDALGGPSSRPNRIQRKVYGENEGPIHCPLCNKVWPSLRQQWQHLIRTHREAAATTCGVCLEICSDYASLKAHLNETHPDTWEGEGKNFTCRICGRYHNARSKLELHNTIHLGLEGDLSATAGMFKCASCSNAYPTAEELVEHSAVHLPRGAASSSRKPIKKESEESENLSSSSSSDESEELSEDMQLFVCPACAMVFREEEALNAHVKSKCEHLKQKSNDIENRSDSKPREEADLSNGVGGNDDDEDDDDDDSSSDDSSSSSSGSSSSSDSSSSSNDDDSQDEDNDSDDGTEGSVSS